MAENKIREKIKELIKRKNKKEEETLEKREENFPLLEPFSIHEWDKDFKIIALENQAKQLAREYNALKAIHDYSEKLNELQEHMQEENEASLEMQKQSEINDENLGFEIEDNETTENVETFSQESKALSEGENLNSDEVGDLEVNEELNLSSDLGTNDTNVEINLGIESEVSSELGLSDTGFDFGSSTDLGTSLGSGNGSSCGNMGSGSSGSGGSGSGGN
jgi:hypothetical protein